jgi:hypothetical protein
MSNNIYDILGRLTGLEFTNKPATTDQGTEQVYESVEAKGDIMEAVRSLEEKYMGFKAVEKAAKKGGAEDPAAVAASIGREKYGKKKFQAAAAKGKKLGESDWDGPTDLSSRVIHAIMHQAEKKNSSRLTKADLEEIAANIGNRFTAADVKEIITSPGWNKKLRDYRKHVDSLISLPTYESKKLGESEHCDKCDCAKSDCKCESLEEGKEFKSKEEFDKFAKTGDTYKTEKGTVTKTDSGFKHERNYNSDKKDSDDLDEGAKVDRFVKHVKDSEKKAGKSDKEAEKIAWATANKKGMLETVTEGKDGIRNHPIYTTQEAWDHYKKELDEMTKLAGMQVHEAKCPSCNCAPCKCEESAVMESSAIIIDGKEVDVHSLTVDGVETSDYPDFSDAYLDSGLFVDGTPLTDAQLEQLADQHPDLVNELASENVNDRGDDAYDRWKDSQMEFEGKECDSCKKMPCECVYEDADLDEAVSRKDFRMVADLLKNIPDKEKRKELAHHHASIFKQQNPRFKHDVFFKAAGLDECDWNMEPKLTPVEEDASQDALKELGTLEQASGLEDQHPSITKLAAKKIGNTIKLAYSDKETGKSHIASFNINSDGKTGGYEGNPDADFDTPADAIAKLNGLTEEEMEEGNEFTKARLDAIKTGAKEFEVDGKQYKVTGDTSDEKAQVKEDIQVNITAQGEEDAINLIRKLAGMQVVAVAEEALEEDGANVKSEEPRDIEHLNTPREQVAGTDAAIPSGTDLHASKKQYRKEYPGDNPSAVKEEALWNAYESMINDVKK